MKGYPLLSWQNLICDEDLTITHSPDETSFPFENISDWRDYTFWKSSSTGDVFVIIDAGAGKTIQVDTLAIAGHNLGSAQAENLSISYSDDGSSYFNCAFSFSPADDGLIFINFEVCEHRFFRFIIPTGYSAAPEIAALFIGSSMVIPGYPEDGFDPDSLESEESVEHGRTGNLLGVSRRFLRRRIKADFNDLEPDFIKEEFIPFWKAHSGKPFFFTWDPERTDESYFVKMASGSFSSPYQKSSKSLSLEMTGLVKE
jgi:hypothetical protein